MLQNICFLCAFCRLISISIMITKVYTNKFHPPSGTLDILMMS